MTLLKSIYATILDALFPLSQVERELLTLKPEAAYVGRINSLPTSPKVPIPDADAIFAYKDEKVAKLIWNIKYKKSEHAVKIGGYALYQKLQGTRYKEQVVSDKASTIILIPLPITKQRRRERGYNQTELLVDEIGRLDTDKQFTINKELLIRTQHLSRQTLKDREHRLESAKGIFSVNELVLEKLRAELNLADLQIIIIDDVITTGSTISEAIQTLKDSGFLNVSGLSVAH